MAFPSERPLLTGKIHYPKKKGACRLPFELSFYSLLINNLNYP